MKRPRLKDCPDDIRAIDNNLSASYMLLSHAIRHIELANDILAKYGMNVRDIKQKYNIIERAFDFINTNFWASIPPDQRKQFATDYEALGKRLDEMLKDYFMH